jgi:hypothetical protein
MNWRPFEYHGQLFDLSHIHPFEYVFERPATEQSLAERFRVSVRFSSHCFTRKPELEEAVDPELIYPYDTERRLFDPSRFLLSYHLPELIRNLSSKRVRQNFGRHKFFTVELVDDAGVRIEYDIFFRLVKVGKGMLELIVETAFDRRPENRKNRPAGKPIRFWIILHNTLHGKPIRQ